MMAAHCDCDGRKDEQFLSECQASLQNQQYMSVTCNGMTAVLNRHRLGSGGKGRCIEFEGDLLTPNEFQARCGKASSKDWKRSIRYKGRPLSRLIDQRILSCHAISCICAACSDDVNVQTPIRYFKKWNRKRKPQSVPNSFKHCCSTLPIMMRDSTDSRNQASDCVQMIDSGEGQIAGDLPVQNFTSSNNSLTVKRPFVSGEFNQTKNVVQSDERRQKDSVGTDKELATSKCVKTTIDEATPAKLYRADHSVHFGRQDFDDEYLNFCRHMNPLSTLHNEIVNDIVNEQKCWWHLESVVENLVRETVALKAIVSQTKDASMASKANMLIKLRSVLSASKNVATSKHFAKSSSTPNNRTECNRCSLQSTTTHPSPFIMNLSRHHMSSGNMSHAEQGSHQIDVCDREQVRHKTNVQWPTIPPTMLSPPRMVGFTATNTCWNELRNSSLPSLTRVLDTTYPSCAGGVNLVYPKKVHQRHPLWSEMLIRRINDFTPSTTLQLANIATMNSLQNTGINHTFLHPFALNPSTPANYTLPHLLNSDYSNHIEKITDCISNCARMTGAICDLDTLTTYCSPTASSIVTDLAFMSNKKNTTNDVNTTANENVEDCTIFEQAILSADGLSSHTNSNNPYTMKPTMSSLGSDQEKTTTKSALDTENERNINLRLSLFKMNTKSRQKKRKFPYHRDTRPSSVPISVQTRLSELAAYTEPFSGCRHLSVDSRFSDNSDEIEDRLSCLHDSMSSCRHVEISRDLSTSTSPITGCCSTYRKQDDAESDISSRDSKQENRISCEQVHNTNKPKIYQVNRHLSKNVCEKPTSKLQQTVNKLSMSKMFQVSKCSSNDLPIHCRAETVLHNINTNLED